MNPFYISPENKRTYVFIYTEGEDGLLKRKECPHEGLWEFIDNVLPSKCKVVIYTPTTTDTMCREERYYRNWAELARDLCPAQYIDAVAAAAVPIDLSKR